MCVKESILSLLGHVEVANLDSLAGDEDVGGFKISVKNVLVVEFCQAFNHLAEHLPDSFLRDLRAFAFGVLD